MTSLTKFFTKFSTTISKWTGRPLVFVTCCFLVIAWALSGPMFGFSDTWQLVINTSTTIITFLMVFLIQNTQNRDNNAIHAKLDELIRVSEGHNGFIGIENLTDEELEDILAACDKNSVKLRLDAIKDQGHPSKAAVKAREPLSKPKAASTSESKVKSKPAASSTRKAA